jgi:hypothetical protein
MLTCVRLQGNCGFWEWIIKQCQRVRCHMAGMEDMWEMFSLMCQLMLIRYKWKAVFFRKHCRKSIWVTHLYKMYANTQNHWFNQLLKCLLWYNTYIVAQSWAQSAGLGILLDPPQVLPSISIMPKSKGKNLPLYGLKDGRQQDFATQPASITKPALGLDTLRWASCWAWPVICRLHFFKLWLRTLFVSFRSHEKVIELTPQWNWGTRGQIFISHPINKSSYLHLQNV